MKTSRSVILMIGFVVFTTIIFTLGFRMSPSRLLGQGDIITFHQSVSGLTSQDLKEREKAMQAIQKQYEQLIGELIRLAGQEVQRLYPDDDPRSDFPWPWRDAKHLAILLLGDLRAVEAVPILLENLEYKNYKDLKDIVQWRYNLPEATWYPAAESLSKIGMPAVEPTIKKLVSYEPNSMGSRICRWILKEILGVKLARYRLEIEIEQTKDPVVKERLTAVLPYFKTT